MEKVIALNTTLNKDILTMRWLCPFLNEVKEVTGEANSMYNEKIGRYTHIQEIETGESYIVLG